MGDCFQANASHFLQSSRKDWRLCHGIVLNSKDGMPMMHCWIESEEVKHLGKNKIEIFWVIDMSNTNDIRVPKGMYYHLGRIDPDEVVRYDLERFGELIAEFGTYGPWEIDCGR